MRVLGFNLAGGASGISAVVSSQMPNGLENCLIIKKRRIFGQPQTTIVKNDYGWGDGPFIGFDSSSEKQWDNRKRNPMKKNLSSAMTSKIRKTLFGVLQCFGELRRKN